MSLRFLAALRPPLSKYILHVHSMSAFEPKVKEGFH